MQTAFPRVSSASRILGLLGSNADEVADTLKSLSIQGVRNTARFLNPIVRFARTQCGGATDMDVMTGTTLRIVLPWGTQHFPLPPAVQSFLEAFNRGEYPQLEMDHQTIGSSALAGTAKG
jgi:hypothetical protein